LGDKRDGKDGKTGPPGKTNRKKKRRTHEPKERLVKTSWGGIRGVRPSGRKGRRRCDPVIKTHRRALRRKTQRSALKEGVGEQERTNTLKKRFRPIRTAGGLLKGA